MEDNINDYMPSLLHPRRVKKRDVDLSLTQASVTSCRSLSLRKKEGFPIVRKPAQILKSVNVNSENNSVQNCMKNKTVSNVISNDIHIRDVSNWMPDKENLTNNLQNLPITFQRKTIDDRSIGLSAVEDLDSTVIIGSRTKSPFSLDDINIDYSKKPAAAENYDIISLISISSATELNDDKLDETVSYDITEKPTVSVSFGLTNCDTVDLSTMKSSIKRIKYTHNNHTTNVNCDIVEGSIISIDSGSDTDAEESAPSPPKKSAIAVNLEIKKHSDDTQNSKVLILKTDDIVKLTHVIVQPPNYKLVKRQILESIKSGTGAKRVSVSSYGRRVCGNNLNRERITHYFDKTTDVVKLSESLAASVGTVDVVCEDGQVMSKNLGVAEAGKSDHGRGGGGVRGRRQGESPRAAGGSRGGAGAGAAGWEAPRARSSRGHRRDATTSASPRRAAAAESPQFGPPSKTHSNKFSTQLRVIPYFKIVAGTHFAVDAFSYGDIPNVKHYFLTHFHSDHYSGLKKGFNKLLFCSKITAELCMTRLGVSQKCIHVMKYDEAVTIDGVEVTAVDANHCPGAVMLLFTLPNGKTLLHTGDFRASPLMESYPVFWNKDINTIYLDTTYCNPRYDFPTQEQSLEMALYILRQKKLALEKVGKKFTSVLIVCGTYTIGKEKFFLGMARRVGCSVWACPEKDRVLQAVEGRSFGHAAPTACQLHVVPMRDLTHDKLRAYLEGLQDTFSEVVAFKPSGWENGKNSASEKDNIVIHGIPYSEHSSFSELIRFVKFLKPKQVVPTVDISGGANSVQKYFPCPLVCKDDTGHQGKITDYFSIQGRQQPSAVT